jgi:hypothetical protein
MPEVVMVFVSFCLTASYGWLEKLVKERNSKPAHWLCGCPLLVVCYNKVISFSLFYIVFVIMLAKNSYITTLVTDLNGCHFDKSWFKLQ